MSHRTWIAIGFDLLLCAAAGAQDLSGGFGDLFSPPTVVAGGVFTSFPPAIADFNEDGLPDIAVLDLPSNKIGLLFGQQGLGLGSEVLVSWGVFTYAQVHAADLDGDGHQDLLVVPNLAQMRWLRGHGDGTFDESQLAGPGVGYVQLLLGDVNGDGLADLLGVPNSSQLPLNLGQGAGGFGPTMYVGYANTPTDPLLSDLDDDGVMDLALLDKDKVRVLKGLGGGAFALAQAWSDFAHNGLEVADMNLDGTLDLVHGGTLNVATVLPGLGDLQYGPPQQVSMHPVIKDLTVADLDLDGVPDLLATGGSGTYSLVTRRMGVDGPVGPSHAQPIAVVNPVHGLLAADFDGDSLPDALVPNLYAELALALNQLGPFIDLGHELPGPQITPTLTLFGSPQAGWPFEVKVAGPGMPSVGLLFAGLHPVNIPFAGGLFVPEASLTVDLIGSGPLDLYGLWPAGIPAGTTIYLQAWFTSGNGVISASDAWLIVSE